MLPQNPIMVNSHNTVLDGQHRLEAAKLLGYPIYYIEVEIGSLHDVQILNINTRRWTVEDFLESFIATGKEDYQYLKDFSADSDYSVSICMTLLAGGSMNTLKGGILKDFRNGDFKARHKEYATTLLRKVQDLNKYLDEGVAKDRAFLRALEKTYTVIPHDKLIDKFNTSEWRITRQASVRSYIRLLEDVVSWRSRSLTRIGR